MPDSIAGPRVLVCGGRKYGVVPSLLPAPSATERARLIARANAECQALFAVLDELTPSHMAHGGAHGADSIAADYAKQAEIVCTSYPAKWDVFGNRAGPIRNTQMLNDFRPDVVVACPGGKGTADMVRKAEAAGVRVVCVEVPNV